VEDHFSGADQTKYIHVPSSSPGRVEVGAAFWPVRLVWAIYHAQRRRLVVSDGNALSEQLPLAKSWTKDVSGIVRDLKHTIQT
jgi:hypothetical protein